MDKDEKIKNAAKYWYECEKEGFPKSQEEVFREWLKKDVSHKEEYERLKFGFIKTDEKYQIEIKDKIKKPILYLFIFIFLLIFFKLII